MQERAEPEKGSKEYMLMKRDKAYEKRRANLSRSRGTASQATQRPKQVRVMEDHMVMAEGEKHSSLEHQMGN